ncbi:MAG TPA: hypothetical protein PKE69_26665 [Pyrinomonadaceae bacterium]|nr:hypothetical protein [Pyrinomonadaceae bacterium]
MNRRTFWLIPEFTKFRTIFENAEIILGVSDDNERRLFRKDTEKICFDERKALAICVAALIRDAPEKESFLINKREVAYV